MDVWYRIMVAVCLIWTMTAAWRVHPFKPLNWLFHDILQWHRPNDDYFFDGASVHAHCRICGKEIMQDSQGNWF